jgi:hypothetical protein
MKPTFDIPVSPIREYGDRESTGGWWLPSTLDVVLYFGSLSERVQRDVVLLGGGLCDVYSSDGSRKERVKTIPLRRVPIESKILVPPMGPTSLQWCAQIVGRISFKSVRLRANMLPHRVDSTLHAEFSSFPKYSYDENDVYTTTHRYLTTLCGISCEAVPTESIQLGIPTCPKCLESKTWTSAIVLPYTPPEVLRKRDRKTQQERRARARIPSRYDRALEGPQPKTSILPIYQELDPEDLYVGRELKLQARERN